MTKAGYVLSFDPGDTTGIAMWSTAGELIWTKEMSLTELDDFLLSFDKEVSAIVYEDFRLFSHKAKQQTGSRFGASQAIGKINLFARQVGATTKRQSSNILRVAAMHAEEKIPATGHIKDWLSAYLHGYYYLETMGVLVPKRQYRLRPQE